MCSAPAYEISQKCEVASSILIDNQWNESQSGKSIEMFCPSTGKTVGKISAGNSDDVEAAVSAARRAFAGKAWRSLSAVERGRLLIKAGKLIEDNLEELARLESLDTGKPISQGRADIIAAARYFEYYGSAADKLHGETVPFNNGYTVLCVREPIGVIGQIIPWNYPAQIGSRSIAAALAAGNTTVLKPAEEACLTLVRFVALMVEAGMPPGVLNLVTGYGEEAGAALAAHPGVDYVAFTGSPEVGTLVQQAAATHQAGCLLELGAKSPQVIFEDADLDAALPVVVKAIIQNGGQTCSAASRVIVQQSVYDAFIERVAEKFRGLVAGDHATDPDLGALISDQQRQKVLRMVSRAESEGIPVIARGQISANAPKGGYYVEPCVLGPVPSDHWIARQEVFGPVLCAMPFKDEDDAIAVANDTEYGLVAGVWTKDGARQLRMANAIHAGQVFINGYGAGGGIELPFGGVKRSGHGREKGFEGLREFSVIKTIILNHA